MLVKPIREQERISVATPSGQQVARARARARTASSYFISAATIDLVVVCDCLSTGERFKSYVTRVG